MIKKIVICITIASAICAALILEKQYLTQNDRLTIGIIQTASHPALDAVRQGVTEELEKKIGSSVAILYQNAEGSASLAHTIAQGLHANKQVKAIVTIGTLATQAAVKAEKNKPIIYTAVTNPQGLGIDNTQHNVCGISDQVDIKTQVAVLTKLLPTAKTIGILYNPAEINSVHSVKLMQQELQAKNLTALAIGVQSEADIPLATTTACAKTDALLLPTDNTVASTLKVVVAKAKQTQKPIICGVNLWVNDGVLLAAGGVDYKTSGTIAANYIKQILKEGKQPDNVVTQSATTRNIVINKQVLTELKLTIPASLASLVTIIN